MNDDDDYGNHDHDHDHDDPLIVTLLSGFASDSVFVVIQYLSNSTKMTTNTETAMLSKAAARWRRTRKRESIRQRRASHSSSHNLQC